MVAIEFNNGVSFKINNITLIRNFHAYVSSGNVRIVNAYDTRNELMPYTPFQDISINGVIYNSVEELLEVLTPVLFLKNGGSGTGGAVNISSGNIITKTISVAIDWSQNPDQQIVDFVNAQQFTVSASERILFKAFRLIGDLNTSNSSEIYYWEFKPGKGTYGDAGTRDITLDDIEFISFITNYQNNVIELGEIGATPIEVYVNESGPYVITSSSLNILKATRQGNGVSFIYVGESKNIGDGATQTVSDDYIDVNSQPVNSPTGSSSNVSQRPKREIDKATQHTLVASDFDYELDFTNTGTGVVNLILNDNVAPAGKRLYFIITGNKQVRFVSGTGVTILFPEGATDTIGVKGWGGLVPAKASKTFSANGTLIPSAESGGANVQADWNETDNTSDAFIKNKPTEFGETYDVVTNKENGLAHAPNVSGSVSYSATIDSPSDGFTYTSGDVVNVTATLTETAGGSQGRKKYTYDPETDQFDWVDDQNSSSFSGDYNDLSNKPTIPTAITNLSQIATRSYNDLQNKPSIPSPINNITSIANRSYNDLQDLPFTPVLRGTGNPDYTLTLDDKDKIVVLNTPILIIPTGIFSTGDRVIILNPFSNSEIDIEHSAITTFRSTEGYIDKIKGSGRLDLFFDFTSEVLATGDLIKEYEIFESPNGTLYKVGVDDTGARTSTIL